MNLNEIDEVIKELTDDNDDAYIICLFLYINNNIDALMSLKDLGIKGENLNTLIYKCCPNEELNFFDQTIKFLKSGFLGKEEIFDNLNSSNPICFIPRLLKKDEDHESAYEKFASDFRMKSTPKRR